MPTTTEKKVKKAPAKKVGTKTAKPKVAKSSAASGVAPQKAGKVAPKKAKVQDEAKRAGVDSSQVVLRIRVRAYESKIIDASVKQIMDTAARYDAVIVGPVPLPTEIKKYTVNRSAFIYKNAREQFEIRVHKRLIDIVNPSPKTIEALTNLSLPSGVDIDVKML
jgi:small subunit ribosomal protein S10